MDPDSPLSRHTPPPPSLVCSIPRPRLPPGPSQGQGRNRSLGELRNEPLASRVYAASAGVMFGQRLGTAAALTAHINRKVIDADLALPTHALHALLRIDDPQALDDLQITVARLGDVHVHSNMMLAGHHFRRTTRALGDLCVV